MNIREIIDDCILYDPCRGAVKDLADGNVNVGRVAGELLDFAAEYGVTGNLWHHYVAFLLATDENAFSLACERRAAPEGSLKDVAANDLKAIFELFSIDLVELFGKFAPAISDYTYVGGGKRSRTSAGARVSLLSKALESANDDAAAIDAIADWYSIYGVGEYALYDAFRLISSSGSTEIDLQHITDTETKKLSDLVGYELQKKQLLDNTLAFLDGNSANNVLLYGDGGTGKSSSIKALMCEYAERGLRVIEVFKHQFTSISQLIAKIKDRNYRFILYLDDLSFEEFEIEYKYFKAIIEGGLECRPSNVLIYATSNRRHLIKENFSDRNDMRVDDDEVHRSDTLAEKLSLVARFGLTIYYPSPDQQQYLEIVRRLAARKGIDMPDDELCRRALQWQMRGSGKSGRTATQFVASLSLFEGQPKN